MRTVLFVLPDLRVGGTCSSFNVLYNHISKDYDISVLPLSNYNDIKIDFADKVIHVSRILSLFYANSKILKNHIKAASVIVKLIGRIVNSLGCNFEEFLFLRQRQKLLNYDVVVAYQEGYVTKFCSKIKAGKRIAWIHCNYDYYLPKEKDESLIYEQFNRIVCVSEYTSQVFIKRYPLLKPRVICVYNLLDLSRILNLANEEISDIKIESDKFIILSVGRIAAIKRFEEIPKIANNLRRKQIDFRWYIIGPDCDPPTTKILLEGIKTFHVDDCVKWLGGKANPYPYFRKSNLYVCLSESEACPMVFIEANILGVPVVTTDFGSSFEFVKHNQNGLISKRNDIENCIETVYMNKLDWRGKELINNPENHNNMILKKVHDLLS